MPNMSSKDKDSLKNELLYLIYQHLSENGYKKAANEVKKHVLQKGSPVLSASLQDIYTSWMKAPENLNKRKLEEGALGSPVKRPRQSDPVSSSESSEDEKTDKKPVKETNLTKNPSGKVNLSSPGKPAKKPPSPGKKTLSSGSSDTSDSEAEQKPPGKASDKPAPVLSASKATKDSSSSSSEETDSEEELQKVPQKAVGTSKTSAPSATPAKTVKAGLGKTLSAKPTPTQAKATPVGKQPESSETDSGSSDSEDEAPAQKAAWDSKANSVSRVPAKLDGTLGKMSSPGLVKSARPAPSLAQATPKTPESSGSDSESSSESEQEAPPPQKAVGTSKTSAPSATPAKTVKAGLGKTLSAKPTPTQAKATPVAKQPESSETDSGSSDSEDEAPGQKAAWDSKANSVSRVPAKLDGTLGKMSSPGLMKSARPAPSLAQATPKTPESSGSDSESSSESEQEAPAPQKTLGCLSAKSQSSSKPVPGKVSTLKSPLKSTKPTSSLAKLAPAVEKKPDSTESDSGSSETEEEAPKQKAFRTPVPSFTSGSPAKATPKTPWVDKEVKSTESGSSDSSLESEEEKPAAKTQQKLVKNSTTKSPAVKPAAVNPELTGSESEESSDTEQNVSQKSLQKAQAVKTPAPVPKTALKTSTKSTLGKPEAVKAHLGKVSKATDMKAPANLLKATAKSAVQKQSSESVSSDSSESEDEVKTSLLKTPQKKAITPKQSATSHALPVKPSAESDSSSSEDEPSQSLLASYPLAVNPVAKSTLLKRPATQAKTKKAGTAEESKSKDPDPPASAKAKSEDSTTDSSTDLEHRQPPAKMPKVATPKKISSHAVPKKKNTSKSDSSSEDSSDDEEQPVLTQATVQPSVQSKLTLKSSLSRNPAAKAGHKKTATATKGTKKPSPLAAPVPPNNESDSDSSGPDVEKWKLLARTLTDSDISVMASFQEPAVSTVTGAAETQKKKEKEKAMSNASGQKAKQTPKQKAPKPSASKAKKTEPPATIEDLLSLVDHHSSSSESNAEDTLVTTASKAQERKKVLLSERPRSASSEEEEEEEQRRVVEKRKAAADVGAATPDKDPVAKKKKKKKDKKEKKEKKLKTASENGGPVVPIITKSSPRADKEKRKENKKSKSKLKGKRKTKIKKTPFRPSQGIPFDTPSSMGTSPALISAVSDKKKKSSKNK
ncbi:nucleolar protein dao-5-like isoform X2 [Lepisosteus oculatus]|uniref:nucleolar protein dao-5-like isoform X2 n=1 Tax=Lepisosteus oculatus TaxID=7918 RepID=UPI0035F52219